MSDDISTVLQALNTVTKSLKELEAKRDAIMQSPPENLRTAALSLHDAVCNKNHEEMGFGCSFRRESSWSRPTHQEWLRAVCENIARSGASVEEYQAALEIVFAK